MKSPSLLFITEFAGHAHDGLSAAVCRELAAQLPEWRVHQVSGWLTRYTYGGLRPSRLANYAVVYGRSLAALLRHRPAAVVVDTTPPLLQWWMAWWAPLVGARVYVWMNDYHPELEARHVERIRGLRWAAAVLRALDRRALRRISGMVALDTAMAKAVHSRWPEVPMRLHPTWSEQGTGQCEPVALNDDAAEFRLAYVGNLGVSHGLADLELLLGGISRSRRLRMLAVGGNVGGRDLLKALSERLNVSCEFSDRLPWDALKQRLNAFKPNYALVLMDEAKRGLLSPSKYSTYLQLGLPILYLGPRDTNADLACREQGAGVAIAHDDLGGGVDALLASVLDSTRQDARQAAAVSAFEALRRFNAASFVAVLRPWLDTDMAGAPLSLRPSLRDNGRASDASGGPDQRQVAG